MASGVPCVATDIGDSAWIVARTGLIVPPSDAEALAEALGCLATLGPEGRQQLGAAARARVIEEFEVDEIVHRYEMLYEQATVCSLVAAKA
jgi:glycosyltransferase involved in cell wall biosynthesis